MTAASLAPHRTPNVRRSMPRGLLNVTLTVILAHLSYVALGFRLTDAEMTRLEALGQDGKTSFWQNG